MSEVVNLLKRLVTINSEVYVKNNVIKRVNYDKIAELIESEAKKRGLYVEKINLNVRDGIIPTLLISTESSIKADVALVCHYDVVPARGPWIIEGKKVDPYTPLEIDGKVYGRGAADDKSAIASGIIALEELIKEERKLRYEPVLVVTGDEEVGGNGIRALLDEGYRWDRAIILDASVEYIGVGASGVIHAWIKVKGKGGHAGYAHQCINPVEALIKLLNNFLADYKSIRYSKISKYNSPPSSPIPKVWGRVSATIIKLGENEPEKHNIIPNEAIAGLDIRLIPEEDLDNALNELYKCFNKWVSILGINAELTIVSAQRGWYTKDEKLIKDAENALGRAISKLGWKQSVKVAAELGGNDGTYFFLKGIPVIAYGAIRSDNNIHTRNEFVYVRDLILLKEFIKEFLIKS